MYFSFILSLLLVVLSSLFFSKQRKWLSVLLILESMMLLSLMIILLMNLMTNYKADIFLIILTLAVSEAALGLTLLINYIKISGSDTVGAMNMM
uniref:NADH-ubiquinone oxidoreductase chain 4L n=1 Tax=Oospira bensoni TaxID=1885789 RepID=A0A224A170_9EUPU|nr:NADH dehydrogenase subunit 4L [Oospira bensoni]